MNVNLNIYAFPLKMALLVFPFVALIIALPLLIVQYRRYGSFLAWRAVVLYSFIYYLITAYFLVILPLPDPAAVAKLVSPRYNLIPFNALRNFLTYTVFRIGDPSTWLAALKQPWFIQPAFNVVLTLPFGVYLRYYFKRPLWQIAGIGFLLSLFFELTQLSGLYGIYPRPYRMFDVDDLILNTTGAFVGGVIAPVLMRAFPTREAMDEKSVAKGQRVTWTRRLVAFILDNGLVWPLVAGLLDLVIRLLGLTNSSWQPVAVWVIALVIVHVLMPLLFHGATLGMLVVRLGIVTVDEGPANVWRLALRAGLLYLVTLQSWRGFLWAFTQIYSYDHQSQSNYILLVGFGVVAAFTIFNFIWNLAMRHHRFFYDVWAGTKLVARPATK
ncbi:VanZ family protein [Lacticaseibacillus yichunensis]|uniref:VanZ family protein n=1 Tax=Lacticaseibacillus yichunensis TaxID=2486015 RepID=A0ABW4CRY3_9LACO|nr:VanZ family protein [Lacticaseibacillus yichunensis]